MHRMVRAVILAAGASARMGRPKATLPLSHRADTFLSRIVRSLGAAGLPDIVVVTGAAEDEVRRAGGRYDRRVRFVHNARWQEGQLTSLLAGLDDNPTRDLEAALVTLVDVPLVTPETIAAVVHAWRHSRAPLVRPARGATHGHPVIFDRSLFDELRAADPARGAKSIVRAHAHEILEVAVDDPGAFVDVDTREEYAAMLAELNPRSGPLQD